MLLLSRIRLLILTTLLVFSTAMAQAIETKARAAFVLDQTTGTVLLAKNPDQAMPPASMSKLMTLNMVFEALEDGRLSLDDELPVSEHAMSYGGSTMFLNTRDKVRVEDLILGVIVLSGNDACAVLAEALAGTETEFARVMTERAKQLGMENSSFGNSNGWPHPMQRMSARDLAILADRLISEFPQYYGYFAVKEFAFDGRSPANKRNRNPLLSLGIGADGLKTGHTKEAGYGLVGSAQKNGRRIIVMISGLDSAQDRAREAEKLINWGFRQFIEKKILEKGQQLAEIEIWLGEDRSVALEIHEDLTVLLPANSGETLEAEVVLREPVQAPIAKGQELGRIRVTIPDLGSHDLPLYAANDVAESGFMSRFRLSASMIASGFMGWIN